MDLKDFIKETIGGIIDATSELQDDYEKVGIVLNPPVSLQERDLYEEQSPSSTYRRVETVEFDVAVTAATDSAGDGKVGIKIMSVAAGASGEHRRSNEQVSRVRFAIPLTLPKSAAEDVNKEAQRKSSEAIRKRPKQSRNTVW